MLKGINPRITPEMLYVMAQMGHGDDLAIVDANFPAYALARHLPHDRVLHFAGRLPGAVQTVLTLLPQVLTVFAEYEQLVLGLAMMLVMIFLPQGLLPSILRKVRGKDE